METWTFEQTVVISLSTF